jgi:uncharacterized protein YraI
MFKSTVLAFTLTVAAIAGVSTVSATEYEYGYVAEYVEFHSGPSPKFYQFGEFKACTEVKIDENSPGDGPKWYRVSWGDHYGWVRADDVSYDADYCDEYKEDADYEYEDDHKKPTASY